ncbi:MAG: sigma-70 family RNA polymerase sigma factor [Caldimonas sp.]
MSNPTRAISGDSSSTSDDGNRRRFECLVLPHLDAGYNLARWLMQNDHDAQDAVQESFVRAMRYLGGLRSEGARSWLLQIVRHTCFSRLNENRAVYKVALYDSKDACRAASAPTVDETPSVAVRKEHNEQINAAIAGLPLAYREVLVLRDLEDLSNAEIAQIVDVPVVTVMSRLSHARCMMRMALTQPSTPSTRPARMLLSTDKMIPRLFSTLSALPASSDAA